MNTAGLVLNTEFRKRLQLPRSQHTVADFDNISGERLMELLEKKEVSLMGELTEQRPIQLLIVDTIIAFMKYYIVYNVT